MADDTTTTGPYVLAIDLGTGGPKVAIVSMRGEVVAHEVETNEIIVLPGGGVEQDPDEWWRTIVAASRRMIDRRVVDPDDIVAICIGAQWMATVPVDRHGNHLDNAISWMDSRGAPYVKDVVGGGIEVPGVGYNAKKAMTWIRRSGGIPSLSGKDNVGHILYLKHNKPELYRDAHAFLEPMDYLNCRLTGKQVASYDTIVGHWVTDNRDLAAVQYDPELIELAQIDGTKLPDLVPTGSVIGPLTPGAADALGLTTDAQVVAGMGDTSAAGIGSGAVRDLDAHLYIGTSSWLSCHVDFLKTDLGTNCTALPSGIPRRYWVATEQDVAGKALLWLIDNVLYPDDALGSGPPPDDVFDRLNAMAESVPAGADGTMFLPWLNGERTPVDNHLIRGSWCNLNLETSRSTMVRAVFEGVALNTRWMLGAAEKFVRKQRPKGFEHINFIGGGAQSDLWCQILADVLDRPIRQMAEPRYANARGAAFAAGVALGHLRWDDIPALVQVERTFTPDRANRAVYDGHFAAFTKLYKQTKGVYAKLNAGLYGHA